MSMTGTEWDAYVVRKFKREDKTTELYEATTDIIADMRIQFNSEDYKEEAYSTGIATLGDYKLGFPSDYGHIIGDVSITDVDDDSECVPLKKISKIRYDELYADRLISTVANMATDTPYHYCIYGKQIFLGPVPDKTTYKYQFNYTTEDYSEIEASTDPVPFTDKNRNTLRSGVLMELYNGMENFEEASYWEQKYLTGLGKLASNDETNIQDSDGSSYHGV